MRQGLMLITAGALAVAAVSFPALARDGAAATTELSAQLTPADNNKNARPKNAAPRQAPRAAPVRPAPVRVAPRQAPMRVAPVQRVAPAPRVIQRQAVPQGGGQRNVAPARVVGPRTNAPATTAPRIIAPNTAARPANRAFTPRGSNSTVVRAARIRSVPARGVGRTSIQGRNYSVWRSGYRVRRGNGWRTFVALGALGTIAVGAAEFYPYAYIQAPEPYCDGRTEDGCQLVWEDVETIEGGSYGQCVAYCPWQ